MRPSYVLKAELREPSVCSGYGQEAVLATMETRFYFVALGLALLLSVGLVVYETPLSQFLRHRGVRLGLRIDGTTVLLTIVLVFDVVALVLLVSSAVLPR